MAGGALSDGWQLLAPSLRGERRSFVVLGGWSLVEALPVVVSGHFVAQALDAGFLAGDSRTGVLWLLAYGAALLLGSFAGRQAVPPVARIVESARDALLRAVVRGGLVRAVGSLGPPDTSAVARTTRQVEIVRDVLAGLLLDVRGIVFAVGAAVVGLVSLAPETIVVVLPAVVASGVGLWLLLRALVARHHRALNADESLADTVGQRFSSVRDVVACGAEQRVAAEIGANVEENRDAFTSMARLGSLRALVVAGGARVPLLAILALAPWLVDRGTMTAGEIVGVATYLVAGLEPALRQLVQVIGQVGLQLQVVALRLAAWVDVRPPVTDGRIRPERTDITIEDATFAYGPHAEPVFADLRLAIGEGDHFAVVGPSGIGKSTLANMLARVVAPQEGRVRIGGVDLADVDEVWLRANVAVLPQEAYVFAGSVRENLAYLRSDAEDEDLLAAAAEVGADRLVERLGGLDADIAHPSTLSAGERQLVTLARAYASAARIVVLDEATCHLDPVAERRAEEAFVRRGGTLLVVAHRISSALRARRILILESGGHTIGDHETLMTRSPLYADLVGHWTSP